MNQQDKSFLVTFITVMSVLVMIAVAIFLAARMVSLVSLEADDGLRRAAAAETRIKPVGYVAVADPSKQQATAGELSGSEINAKVCASCHAAGVLGAPKAGSKEEWEPRLAQGMDTLVDHAVNGFKAMPAKGGDPSLSEEDISKAIAFMLEESGLEAGEGAPTVGEAVPAPTADRDLAKGEQVYGSACGACHEAGVAGAPVKGDKAAWEPRAEQGMETLFDHAINGFNAMPPKGGNASLSDDDVKDAVAYMLGEADIEIAAAPAAPPEVAAPAPTEAPPTAQETTPMVAAPQVGQQENPILAAQEAAATALKAAAVALEAAVVAQKIAAAAQESVSEQPSQEARPPEEAAPMAPEVAPPAQPEAGPAEEITAAPAGEKAAPKAAEEVTAPPVQPEAEPAEEATPAPATEEMTPTAPEITPPDQQDTGAPAEETTLEPEQLVVPSPALPAGQEPVPTLPSQDSAPAPQEPPVEQGATTPEEVVAPLPEESQEETAPEARQPEETAPADQETTPQRPTGEAFPEESEPIPTTGQQVESPERKTIPPVPPLTPEQAEVVDEEAISLPPSEKEQEGAPEAPAPGMQSPMLTPVPETFPKGIPKGAPAAEEPGEQDIPEASETAAPPPPEPTKQETEQEQPVEETTSEEASKAPATEEEKVALAKPVTISVPANVDLAYGRQLYNTACIVCHEPGVAGAPRLGDQEAWEPRLAKGWETLVEHAIHGFNAMPPKGGLNVPDDEVISAVGYMVSEAQ